VYYRNDKKKTREKILDMLLLQLQNARSSDGGVLTSK